MGKKYEIAKLIEDTEVTVDVSELTKVDQMFFNATELAKRYGKLPAQWLRLVETEEYIHAYIEIKSDVWETHITFEDLVRTKKGGKYRGTWLHNDLALVFARWLSPKLAVSIDQWTKERLQEEHNWRQKRLEAKTGFLPMTEAVMNAHEDPKFYHYSNEADLINRVVLGMTAKQFKEENWADDVRDALTEYQLKEINRLQVVNTGLIEAGFAYADRKHYLMDSYQRRLH